MTANNSNNILRSILDKEKLFGTNFLDWHRNLRIVLKHDKKLYVLEKPVPKEEPPSSTLSQREKQPAGKIQSRHRRYSSYDEKGAQD